MGFRFENKMLYGYSHSGVKESEQVTSGYVVNFNSAVGYSVSVGGHSSGQPEVMQQTTYYPFGYTLEQSNYYSLWSEMNKKLYNGKELQDDELGGVRLDWYDYCTRFYDPQIGRWNSVDPAAEERQWLSPYNYCSLNPILRVDPTGALDGGYYNYDGTYLGSDGINDDKVYVVNSIDPETASKGMSSSNLLALRDKDFHSGSTDPSATLLSIKHSEFIAIAGTLYAVGSSTFGEAAGIYSVKRNRADAKGKSVYDIAGGGGIYGWSERDKINSPLANKDWAKNANLAVIEGVQGSKDYSVGAFYWHGKDLGLNSWTVSKDYYQVGFNFTNTSHDLWNQGNKVSDNSGWDYKYQSTGAAGNTTFMKLTYAWIKANKCKGKW